MVKAILFDMDGVLIDTERLNLEFMIEVAKEFGCTIDPDDILSLRSASQEECDIYYRSRYGEDFDFYAIRDERRKRIRQHIEENGLELKDGVEEVLDHADTKDLKKAVVTSTEYDRAMGYIRMLGIEDRFDTIVSASMVRNGKPDPDVYVYASGIIGERPWDCIAVEDSHNGVRSAYNAGCMVAVVPDLAEADEDMRNMGTWVLDSIDQLIGIMDELLRE